VILAINLNAAPEIEEQWTSSDYGYRRASKTACWKVVGKPSGLSWVILPIRAGEDEQRSYSFVQNKVSDERITS